MTVLELHDCHSLKGGRLERNENAEQWIEVLRQQVEKKSIVLLRLSENEFATLLESKRGITEFTMAKRHGVLAKASLPCLLLIFAIRPDGYLSRSHSRHVAYAAVLASKSAVTSLDTRIKVKRSVLLHVKSAQELARSVHGSHVTGKAVFRKGEQTLEVYTANRRNLEEAFGVDLVYVNRFHSNVVMVQYKMLEPNRGDGEPTDWIYHEDNHIGKQIRTMNMFASATQEMEEYRLNSDPFYFKFVRRQGPSGRTNVLLPLSHFKSLLEESDFRTRSGAVKVNSNALKGRYLRQAAFFSLIQCGYIGSDIETSRHLRALVEDAVDGGKALVWAVQRKTREAEREAERVRQVRLYEERLDEEF